MIKLQIQGGAVIYSISQVLEIPSKTGGDPFRKRELIIDDSWTDRDGIVHPNFVLIEFTGDKMGLLDNFRPGQRVNVEARVNGREHNGRVYTSIKGLGITPYQELPQQGYSRQPQQGYAPQPTPGYGGYPQQPAYPQPGAPQPASFPQQYPSGGSAAQYLDINGLPFNSNA